ncbi:hypothetical protein HYH02_004623 [Chlamydomonas schloesseri]|uniref:Uncharacterized protein n=1 Tax=Chlamydomonas schloesseri TaxID=2026947 RepID=A0A836B8D2_9CHLO|nr:hypothetical protein HYH02_004623 [Chlamydomonas schloesseri]|eukprot:KAG2450786.1 hypothetical protein HYH02_004623 [Chlamydomonas schloesseri]
MDSTLANIRAWKQKHEREMLEMRQHNEQVLQAQATGSPSDAQPDAQPGASAAGALPTPAASASMNVALGDEEDADLLDLVRERRERQERLVSGIRHKYSAAQQHPAGSAAAGGGQGPGSDSATVQALMGASGIWASVRSVDQPPLESLLRNVDVRGMLDPTAAAAVGDRVTYVPGGASGAPDRPMSAARKKAEAAANEAVLRGQQLMAELEAELRALEGPAGGAGAGGAGGALAGAAGAGSLSFTRPGSGGGPLGATGAGRGAGLTAGNGLGTASVSSSAAAADGEVPLDPLLDWSVQLQGVLAKMDALQTGYQAAAVAVARGGADGGAGGGSSRPGSGAGAGGGAGKLRTGSGSSLVPPRPGSARIKLDPLPQAQALLAAAAVAAASGGASGGAGRRPGSSGSASAAGGGRQEQVEGEQGEGTGPEPVPFAGNRIRQLREMQRQDSAQ